MNVYTIGVRLALHDNLSAGLAGAASQFIGFHHHVGNATAGLRQFQQAAAGALGVFVGVQMFQGIGHMIDKGGELLKIQNQMTAGGWKQKDLAEATAKAWELSGKYQSIGVAQILEMQKEMAPVLGDRHHATEMAEQMTKMQVSMQGILGVDKAANFNKQIRDAIRAGELAGEALKPERFKAYLDSMVKVLNAFGGTVTPSDFFMATKYGRASALNWSDEFRERILPTIIQELGGSSTGTAFMSMYQALIGGTIHKRNIGMFSELGLIDTKKIKPEDITPEGHVRKMSPGAITNARGFMENPYQWVTDTLVPAMLAKGVMSQAGLDQVRAGNIKEGEGAVARKQMTETIALLFGNRTAQGMVDLLALQPGKIQRDSKLIGEAMSTDDAAKFFGEKDYQIAKEKVEKRWHDLMTAIASPNMDVATKALSALAGAISSLVGSFAASPGMGQALVIGIASLATALVVVGAALLTFAVLGAGGLLTAAALAVTLFVGAITALNWESIKGFAGKIGDSIANALSSLGATLNLGAMVASIGTAISNALAGIGAWIKGSLGFGGGAATPGGGAGGSTMDGFGPPGTTPQNFVPPARENRPIQVNSSINVDGRRMAQSVSHHIVRESDHVNGPATYDHIRAPTPVDFTYA